MREAEMVQAAEVDSYPVAAAAMTEGGDGWFGRELAVKAARLAVTAWAMAVNGDRSALEQITDPFHVDWLLNPEADHSWRRQWVVAPGPVLTELTITSLHTEADPPQIGVDPPQLGVKWQFTGRRRWIDPDPVAGQEDEELVFVGLLTLHFTGSGTWPWRLSFGHVQTEDQYLGYTFSSSAETREECLQRIGGRAASAGALMPTDTYLIEADFTEDDVKFGSIARVEVSSDVAPTREEAVHLAEPAMQEECVRWRGGEVGDWHPSMRRLRVIRLLGPAELPGGATDRSDQA
jgi:hypothetical protein